MKLYKSLPAAILLYAACLTACTSSKYAVTNKSYKQQAKAYARSISQYPPVTPGQDTLPMSAEWVGTTNFGLRKPNYVILHHTAQDSIGQTLKTFTLPRTSVSAHYVVAKDGKIYHMLNDYLRAWHAGVARWGNATDINSSSIGIEIDNNGLEPFNDVQIQSVLKLLGNLKKNYGIPTANFIAHADIAPKRKPDPNENFPWKLLASQGYGLWYDDSLQTAPHAFDAPAALRIIGYDTGDLSAAIVAFKRHFIQVDLKPQLTQRDLDVLYNLYKKYW